MEDDNGKVKGSGKKRSRKPKELEFLGWGSRNLIEFLQSLDKDTTNKIPENEVTDIIQSYIRKKNSENPPRKKKKTKLVACDDKLRSLFGIQRISILKVPDLVEKHYLDYQEDSYYDYLYTSEDDKQQSLSSSDKVSKGTKEVVQKPKGTFAAIVTENVKLVYLRKSLMEELAKTPETFESKVVGTFVGIKNPRQIVHVTGVKEGNPIDGHILQVTNYCYYLTDVTTSSISDDDFSQEECEELHQRMKSFDKRLTVVDMEEKARILHEDVTKHWIARELVLLQRRIDQANEKGWRRELSQYVEKRGLLRNAEEQLRLLREVPEIIAEEPEPECVDDDKKIENDLTVPNPEASVDHQSDEEQPRDSSVSIADKSLENSESPEEYLRLLREDPEVVAEEVTPEFIDDDVKTENDFIVQDPPDSHQSDSPDSSDGEDLPRQTTSAGNKDLHEDVEEQPPNSITQNKDFVTEERPRDSPVSSVDKSPEKYENPEEHLRLLREDPEVVAEEPTPEYIDVDNEKIENDFIVQNPPESHQSDSPDSSDGEDQLRQTSSVGNKDLHEDVEDITQNKDFITEVEMKDITQNKDFITEVEMSTNVSQDQLSIPVIDLSNQPEEAQSKPLEIILLSDDDDEQEKAKDNGANQDYDPKKEMWFYEWPEGNTHGPFSLTDLKRWNDEKYFVGVPDFKVWMKGESKKSAVLLAKILDQKPLI